MKQRLTLLHSKLIIPKTTGTLVRTRLIEVIQTIGQKKLALVIAAAGYGKTTLLAQTVAALQVDTVWYCLDEADQDFTTFLSYLLTGIRKYHAEFGKDLEKKSHFPSTSPKHREGLLLDFLTEAEKRINDEMILVLDDFYKVQDSPEIIWSIEFLLARMPPVLHLVIVSRKYPDLRISRYRSMLEVIELGEAELSFQIGEIKQLFVQFFKFDLGVTDIDKLFEKTGGWAAGLILCYLAWESNPAIGNDCLTEIGRSRQFIHQYLEENIFANQPADTKVFMLKTSLLSRLEPELCAVLFPGQPSREILQTLCDQHLFTFPYGEGASHFQYHQLLQDFLREEVERSFKPNEVAQFHHAIGMALEGKGRISEAMRHFLEGGHHEEFCRLIGDMVFQDFLDCSLGFLREALNQIPATWLESDARLVYVRAKLASLRGDLQQAITGYKDALAKFQAAGDGKGVASSLKDLGVHYYLTGNVQGAYQQMTKLWGQTHPDPFFPAEVAGFLILFSAILGRWTEADSYFDTIRSSLTGADAATKKLVGSWLNLCYSNRHYLCGDFEKALELTLKALEVFTRSGLEPFLPLANMQAALICFYQARPVEGHRYAVTGLSLANQFGIYDHQYAWLLYTAGLNSFGKGDFVQAVGESRESLAIFSNHGNCWGQASVYELLSLIQREQQNLIKAEEYIEAGQKIVAGLPMPVTQGSLALRRAQLLIDQGAYGDALSLLENYGEYIAVSRFNLFCRHLLHSQVHYRRGEVEKAATALQPALVLAREYGYSAWFYREAAWVVPVLVRCYSQEIMADFLEEIFSGGGREIREALGSLKGAPNTRIRRVATSLQAALPLEDLAPLRIQCLGAFLVSVGGKIIPTTTWRSAKGEKLFKLLVVKGRQEFVPKEMLLEALWPQEDPSNTNSRFHVTLSGLRKLLEPNLKRGVPSSYIVRQGEAYRLEIGALGSIDFLEFLQASAQAEKIDLKDANGALASYLKAESLYGGPLLPADPYDDGFREERENLEGTYLRTLGKIIGLYEGKGDWQKGCDYAEKYLAIDAYAESIYCALMRCQAQLGEIGRVAQTFSRCKDIIMANLDCPVSDNTVALYLRLTEKMAQ